MSQGGADVVASVRAVLFYAFSLCIALPIFALMIVISPFVFLFDRQRREIYGKLNTFWATMSTRLFFNVDVHGRENLPPEDEAVVFVANHASYLVREKSFSNHVFVENSQSDTERERSSAFDSVTRAIRDHCSPRCHYR